MSIVDGKGLITWEGGLFVPGSDLLRRVQWAFAHIRAEGGHIVLNEAGRPFGVPSDANVRNSSQTASGRSTVWFQWGRYRRGETPSAADPRSGNVYASEHTQGIAIDCDAQDANTVALRTKYFGMVGMVRTIPSESWHYAIRGPVQGGVQLASSNATPIEEEEDMTPEQDNMLKSIYGFLVGGGTDIGTFKPAPGTILARLQHVESIVAQPVSRDGKNVPQIQDNADTGTLVRKLLTNQINSTKN